MPSQRTIGWFVLVVRVALGALFIFAAYLKLSDPQSFGEAVKAFKILPDRLAPLATLVVPWTELVLGLTLATGFWTRSAALTLGLLIIGFMAGLAWVIYQGDSVKCGCFGKFEIPCTDKVGACHLIRNSFLLAAAALVFWKGPGALAIDREPTKPPQ